MSLPVWKNVALAVAISCTGISCDSARALLPNWSPEEAELRQEMGDIIRALPDAERELSAARAAGDEERIAACQEKIERLKIQREVLNQRLRDHIAKQYE